MVDVSAWYLRGKEKKMLEDEEEDATKRENEKAGEKYFYHQTEQTLKYDRQGC